MSVPLSKLGPRTFLFTPSGHAPGELAILCTWLGAAKKNIQKYMDIYRNIAPRSKILIIESAVPILVSSYPSQRKAIAPAVQAIRTVLDESAYRADIEQVRPPKILLHTFSNGGTNTATQMLIVLGEQLGALPLLGVICDSGPAKGDYWKSHNAMVLSLPNGLARATGAIVIHAILLLLFASVAAGRYDKPEDLIRQTLLDDKLVSAGPGGYRQICYIFSKADRMVDWRDVVAHADAARAKGWEVAEVLFDDTSHCNHISSNEKAYCDKIRHLWNGKKLVDRSKL